jgi:hypothetical protein
MDFNKHLVRYKGEEIYYGGIKIQISRQNVQDYVLQTGMNPESIIIFYYKKELSQIRDKQLEKLLNDREK